MVGSNCQRPNNIGLDPTGFIFRLSCFWTSKQRDDIRVLISFGDLQILPYLGWNGSYEVSAFRHRALLGIASLVLLARINTLYSIMQSFIVLKDSNPDLSGRGLVPFIPVRCGSLARLEYTRLPIGCQ